MQQNEPKATYMIIFDHAFRVGNTFYETAGPFESILAATDWLMRVNACWALPLPSGKLVSNYMPAANDWWQP